MQGFFTWCVRNPAGLIAGLSLFSGFAGILEWGLALSGVCVFGVIAELADMIARHAQARREKKVKAELRRIEAERKLVRGKFSDWLNQNDERQDYVA